MLRDDGSDVGQIVWNPLFYLLDDLSAEEVVHRVEVVADRTRMMH